MLTEVALQHRVIPGIAEFARGRLPAPPSTDDGNKWVDGHCWLYCSSSPRQWPEPPLISGSASPWPGQKPDSLSAFWSVVLNLRVVLH